LVALGTILTNRVLVVKIGSLFGSSCRERFSTCSGVCSSFLFFDNKGIQNTLLFAHFEAPHPLSHGQIPLLAQVLDQMGPFSRQGPSGSFEDVGSTIFVQEDVSR